MQTKHAKYEHLLERCTLTPPTVTAIAHPCDEASLRGAVEAADRRLITPILVGPVGKIQSVAKQHCIDISQYELINSPHSQAAAEIAVPSSVQE